VVVGVGVRVGSMRMEAEEIRSVAKAAAAGELRPAPPYAWRPFRPTSRGTVSGQNMLKQASPREQARCCVE